jgi:hypothetical protein
VLAQPWSSRRSPPLWQRWVGWCCSAMTQDAWHWGRRRGRTRVRRQTAFWFGTQRSPEQGGGMGRAAAQRSGMDAGVVPCAACWLCGGGGGGAYACEEEVVPATAVGISTANLVGDEEGGRRGGGEGGHYATRRGPCSRHAAMQRPTAAGQSRAAQGRAAQCRAAHRQQRSGWGGHGGRGCVVSLARALMRACCAWWWGRRAWA